MRRVLASGHILLIITIILAGCGSSSNNDEEPTVEPRAGQITRPEDVGLALDNERAVQAFDAAEVFLVEWFFLQNIDRTLNFVNPDQRSDLERIITGTQIEGACKLVQVIGEPPGPEGSVIAGYAIENCQVVPPEAGGAVSRIDITVILTDQNAWIIDIGFNQ